MTYVAIRNGFDRVAPALRTAISRNTGNSGQIFKGIAPGAGKMSWRARHAKSTKQPSNGRGRHAIRRLFVLYSDPYFALALNDRFRPEGAADQPGLISLRLVVVNGSSVYDRRDFEILELH